MGWWSDTFEILCDNWEKVKVVFGMDTCDREVLTYIATTGGITWEMVRDPVAESIEWCFGKVESVSHVVQWLTENAPGYEARKKGVAFARMMGGVEVCTTRTIILAPMVWRKPFVKTFKRDHLRMHEVADGRTITGFLPPWF